MAGLEELLSALGVAAVLVAAPPLVELASEPALEPVEVSADPESALVDSLGAAEVDDVDEDPLRLSFL